MNLFGALEQLENVSDRRVQIICIWGPFSLWFVACTSFASPLNVHDDHLMHPLHDPHRVVIVDAFVRLDY